jgi:hypothetical protein
MKMSPSFGFRYIRLFLIGASMLGAIGLALAYGDAWHQKSQAAQFLGVLSRVEVGCSTENEVLTATKPFNRYEDNARKPDQQGTETEVAYTFRNRAMAFLHLAPPKFVYAGIEFKDGIVVKKSVNFYQEPRFV